MFTRVVQTIQTMFSSFGMVDFGVHQIFSKTIFVKLSYKRLSCVNYKFKHEDHFHTFDLFNLINNN